MLPAPFNPTPAVQAQILDALTDPTLSLRAVAAEHNTDSVSLAAWLETDQAQAKLDTISRATRARIELIAANQTLAAIAAAHRLLTTFNEEEAAPTNPQTRSKRECQILDCRARLAAIRAANFLLRISRSGARGATGSGATIARPPRPTHAATSAPSHDDAMRAQGATGSGPTIPRLPRPTNAATSGSTHVGQGGTPVATAPRLSATPRITPDTDPVPPPRRGPAAGWSTGRKPGESARPSHPAAERPASAPSPRHPTPFTLQDLTQNGIAPNDFNGFNPRPEPLSPERNHPAPHRRNTQKSPTRLLAAAGTLPSGP